ncbi:MAG: carboxylating nicotinate-nucleotide diphosphorylase [Bacteroidota bacterium]|jgi:nicotinate-nucleotide pyrophosphorylase (carboxylating)|nr:carboxylating nicotinate-nucleotide diphosphorylase [Bacteroidota bacterium]MCA6444771.1 carboxylating nicotinate-nucleotide diphosphorylase [Bacteroidota bacterium]
MNNFIKQHQSYFNLSAFITQAFKEDEGHGDHTSLSTIPKNKSGKMKLLVKEDGILAGVEAAFHVLKHADKKVKITPLIKDGATVKKGDVAFLVEGNLQKLLLAERLLLNIMQRMSGIATKTHQLQQLCKGTKAKVIDTRKTTPGFRFFEKWAVVIGGGANHRYGLFDMILIKDNHVDFAGGIENAIKAANVYLKKNKLHLPIEIETRNLEDIKKVLATGKVNRIMLDNYSIDETKKAVRFINGSYEIESSGGITEATIANYAKCGVDFISIGALTHHVKSLDLSFKAVD